MSKLWAHVLTILLAAARYLDRNGNGKMNLASSSDELTCFNSVKPDSPNVDWVCDERGLKIYQIPGHTEGVMAVFGQRFGVRAPFNQRCEHCLAGHGVFEHCAIAVDRYGSPLFNGACMNCAFRGFASSCSFGTFGP